MDQEYDDFKCWAFTNIPGVDQNGKKPFAEFDAQDRRAIISRWYNEVCAKENQQTSNGRVLTLDGFLDSYDSSSFINMRPVVDSLSALAETGRYLPCSPSTEDAYLYGLRISTGSIGEGFSVNIYGDQKFLQDVKNDIGSSGKIWVVENGGEVHIGEGIDYTAARQRYQLSLTSALGRYLSLFDAPVGKTRHLKFNLPEWTREGDDYKAALTAGLFDGNLYMGNNGPVLIRFYKHRDLEENLKAFVDQVMTVLNELGIPTPNKGRSITYSGEIAGSTLSISSQRRHLEVIREMVPFKNMDLVQRLNDLIERKKGQNVTKTDEAEVLAFLKDGPTSILGLQQKFGIGKSAAASYLKRLREGGQIKVSDEKDPNDSRRIFYEIVVD